MTTYTTVADSNGDFIVPFSTEYSSGEKITVTAEKDSATKSIEIYAPSKVIGSGTIQFTGSLNDFPGNIGGVIISGISGIIGDYAFQPENTQQGGFQRKATSLQIFDGVTKIGASAFKGWSAVKALSLPSTLLFIGSSAFSGLSALTSLIIPNSVDTIDSFAFEYCTSLTTLTLGSGVRWVGGLIISNSTNLRNIYSLATVPPNIISSTFGGLHSSATIYVPADSVAAYRSAPNWSTFASRIQAI